MPENENVAEVFMLAQDQVIIGGMGQIIGLDLGTALQLIDLYEIPDRRDALLRMRRVFGVFQEEHNAISRMSRGK